MRTTTASLLSAALTVALFAGCHKEPSLAGVSLECTQDADCAGNGGRGLGIPRFPSMEFISAVSSPQTKAPAPSITVIS